jgi:hypothetical protein
VIFTERNEAIPPEAIIKAVEPLVRILDTTVKREVNCYQVL